MKTFIFATFLVFSTFLACGEGEKSAESPQSDDTSSQQDDNSEDTQFFRAGSYSIADFVVQKTSE